MFSGGESCRLWQPCAHIWPNIRQSDGTGKQTFLSSRLANINSTLLKQQLQWLDFINLHFLNYGAMKSQAPPNSPQNI